MNLHYENTRIENTGIDLANNIRSCTPKAPNGLV